MSWSLRVSNGDLSIGSGGLNTVTGSDKLVQDLSCALLEPMGNDSMHPTFGSLIDGGTDASGNISTGYIGQPNNDQNDALVASEVQRIARTYQASQIARNNSDVAVYGKSTLTADEALLGLSSLNVQRAQDQLLITAVLQTGAGSLPLALPFNNI